MKKIFYILIIILLLILIGVTLYQNKKEIEEEAALAELKVEMIPVRVFSVQKTTFKSNLSVNGIFSADQEISLFPQSQGEVIRIYKPEGSMLKRGDLIAKIDESILRSQLEVAESNLENAKKDLQRFRNMAEGGAVTTKQLEQVRLNVEDAESKVQTLKEKIEDTNIRAPIDGILNELNIKAGSSVGPGSRLGEIIGINNLNLELKLTGEEVIEISQGQKVNIITDLIPDKVFQGKVTMIDAKAGRSFQYKVKVTLAETDDKLKPGMFAKASFIFPEEEGLLVPSEAILKNSNDPFLYVVVEGKAVKKAVKLGKRLGNEVEIRQGVEEGDLVVLEGKSRVTDGSGVRVVE